MRRGMRSIGLALDCGAQDRLVPIDVAFKGITGDITAIADVEHLPLTEAVGRVLVEDIATQIPLPRFDHSAVDGYGLTGADIEGRPPYRLRVAGQLVAGSATAA